MHLAGNPSRHNFHPQETAPMDAGCLPSKRWELFFALVHLVAGSILTGLAAAPALHAEWIPVTMTTSSARPGANLTTVSLETPSSAPIVGLMAIPFFIASMFHLIRALVVSQETKVKVGDALPADRLPATPEALTRAIEYTRMLRWLEYALTYALVLAIVALECGISDLFAVIGIALGGLVGALFSALGDLLDPQKWWRNQWMGFTFAFGASLVPWICIWWQTARLSGTVPAAAIPYVISIVTTQFVSWLASMAMEVMYIRSYWLIPGSQGVGYLNSEGSKIKTAGVPRQGPPRPSQGLEAVQRRGRIEFAYMWKSALSMGLLAVLVSLAHLGQ